MSTIHVQPLSTQPRPLLLSVIHTEEEFDWRGGFSRSNRNVSHMDSLGPIHEIFSERNYPVTYMCTYPVLEDDRAAKYLSSLVSNGHCEIGAHMHPWVNPPYVEQVNEFNSYPGNLDEALECRKLELLTQKIETLFNVRPIAYLAGRYGYGERTSQALNKLGYLIDFSEVPGLEASADGGPDYSGIDCTPRWDNSGQSLLRIPHTAGFVGLLCRNGRRMFQEERVPFYRQAKIKGLFSRLGLVNRVRLSIEDCEQVMLRRLTLQMLKGGQKVFLLSFHSPSIVPGHTPYVRTPGDLDQLKNNIKYYLDFFSKEIGGVGVSPSEMVRIAKGF